MEKNSLKTFIEGRWFFPAVFILLVILRVSGLYQAVLDLDESVFAEFANKLLTGSLPYSEVFDNKPPGTYYLFAAVFSVAGLSNLYAVHAVTIIIVFCTLAGLYYVVRRMHGGIAASLTVAWYIFMTHTYEPKYISTSGEILINLPLVLSVLCYFKGRHKDSGRILAWSAVAGLLLGSAVMINYKAGLCAMLFILDTIIIRWLVLRRTKRVFLREVSVLAVTGFSAIFPLAAVSAYFYHTGVLNDFINWGFLYNFRYIDSGTASYPLWKTIARSSYFFISTLPVWLVTGVYLFRKKTSARNGIDIFIFFTWSWLAVSAAAALLGGRTYGHYFIQIAPPASIIAGRAASFLVKQGNSFRLLKVSAVLSVCITLFFFASRVNIDETYRFIKYDNWKALPVFRSAADYVRANTKPGDRIYVWGWGTPVYIYSDRRCSSKVLIANYVSGKSFGSSGDYKVSMDHTFLAMMRESFIREFTESPPELFLDTEKSGLFGYAHFPVKVFPELYNFIMEHYNIETEVQGITIYRLNH